MLYKLYESLIDFRLILKTKRKAGKMMTVTNEFTKSKEYALFYQYKETGDKILRDKLVEKYLYIAKILSKRFINRGIDYEDIYQVAAMGIVSAIERFNPDRGVRFATFATPTVLGEIRHYFRDKGNYIRVPRSLYEIFYKAEKFKRHSELEHISISDLSRALNIPQKDIQTAYKIGDKAFIESLEYEAYADGKMSLSNILGKEDKHFIMIENNDFIKYSLKKLNEKERDFIEKRYYQEMTQSEIAKLWDVSQMYVSRLEKTVLKKLRDLYFHN